LRREKEIQTKNRNGIHPRNLKWLLQMYHWGRYLFCNLSTLTAIFKVPAFVNRNHFALGLGHFTFWRQTIWNKKYSNRENGSWNMERYNVPFCYVKMFWTCTI